MYLKALYLHNFRSYEEGLFEFTQGVNVIRGPNARGKTSLIEAIYFLTTGKSFRTSQTTDMIRHTAQHFYIEAVFVKHGIVQKLRAYYSTTERRITHNTTTYAHLSSLLGTLHGVVIHPDDAAIVKGAPSSRRQLLDLMLVQSDPLYVHHITRYDRAMRQRNHLLKSRNESTIDSWEYEMANSAAYIVQQRALATEAIHHSGKAHYARICGDKEPLAISYKANGAGEHPMDDVAALRGIYRDQFRRHRKREMEMGATFTGPHKDDLMVTLDAKDARSFASEGQQRSCVVALRLAEWDQLCHMSHEKPLMLIDDIGMSLDGSRRRHLVENFSGLGQVFVTTTEDARLHSDEHVIIL